MDKFDKQSTAKVTAVESKPVQIKPPELSTGDLGKVQEILFGQQLRANTAQFSTLNNQIEERLTLLTNTCQQQFADLKAQLDSSITDLKTTQNERHNEIQTKLTTFTDSQTALENSFSNKLRANTDNSTQVQQQLSGQIEKSNKTLTDSLDSTRTELTQMLEKALADLQDQKLDRTALASLFGTVATQLTTEHKPENELNGMPPQQPHQHQTNSVDRR